ncbi:hypothetical protein ABZY58_11180 [Micromonospora tulbaghiae]|uniref:hypothetical protein n=1 Tax=Micromonospora tulbaghiae TaxID=479978 RepID=UPI0033B23680
MRVHDVAWSFHLPCGRCGSTSDTDDCVPAVDSRWTRARDGAVLTVTGSKIIHGKPTVQYHITYPDRPDRTDSGVGSSNLDYFLRNATEATS